MDKAHANKPVSTTWTAVPSRSSSCTAACATPRRKQFSVRLCLAGLVWGWGWVRMPKGGKGRGREAKSEKKAELVRCDNAMRYDQKCDED